MAEPADNGVLNAGDGSLATTTTLEASLQPGQIDFGSRVNGAAVKPFVYGNVARYLGPGREDGHTHEWCVYLKSFEQEDFSGFIKKVTFKLHESFAEPTRTCWAPPYKVTESGWGEFEVTIRIFFHDPQERQITVTHFLKLFNPPGTVTEQLTVEHYDELVFENPSQWLWDRLISAPKLPESMVEPIETDYNTLKQTQLAEIIDAEGKVKEEISEMRRRIAQVQAEINLYKTMNAAATKSESADEK